MTQKILIEYRMRQVTRQYHGPWVKYRGAFDSVEAFKNHFVPVEQSYGREVCGARVLRPLTAQEAKAYEDTHH
jgi:hypothetical protein